MSDFDEYIRQGEPGRSVKAAAWQTAIGLQDVDGLKPSSYLIDTAKRHIEGDVTIEEVKGLIDTYYKSRQGRLSVEEERTEDAGDSKSKNCTLNCTLEELAVLRLLKANPKVTQEQLAEQIHRSPRTVKTLTSRLTEKGYLARRNGKRDGWWEVLAVLPD